MTRKRRVRKPSPLPTLDPNKWLRNSEDIKKYRLKLLKKNNNLCEVTNEHIVRPALDHDHDSGKVRGVLSGFVNMFEGRTRKVFNKYVANHTEMSYPDFLIALGEYLKKDYSDNPLHVGVLLAEEKRLNRTRKDQIVIEILERFGVDLRRESGKMTKLEIVKVYLEYYTKEFTYEKSKT